MAPRRDTFEAQHASNRLVYEKRIKQIFTKVCYECGMSVTQLAGIVEQAGKDADFARIPAVRRVMDKLQKRLAKELQTTVIDGIRAEWKLANDKYDALIGTMVAGDLMERWDEQTRLRTMSRNLEALDAFINRKEAGLNLSQRVWRYTGQMRDAMETALQLGISEGESAAEIARDLKQYLNYPDKLFRRVRDKETGELKLSKPASMFHPGQGVYRSSYKNALRLALNETNIAYRKADSVRRVGLYFVVGIEVHLSNNHNCKGVPEGEFYDICDILKGKYPPDFEFVGWHPACRCWTSTILNTDEEFFRDSDGKYRGSVNEVKDVPPQFKKWLEDNKERIEKAKERGTLPYFLRDNRWAWDSEADRPNEKVEYKNTALDAAEARHAARTEKQVKDIKAKWDMRSRALKNQRYALALLDSIPGMEAYLKKDGRGYSLNLLRGTEGLDGDYELLDAAARSIVSGMAELKKQFDVLDRPWEALKEHGVEKILDANASIRKKMAQWEGQSLDYQLKKLRFEADWVEKNKKGVLSTWEVAKNAYLKAAAEVEWKIEWQAIKDEVDSLALNSYADPDMIAEARSYIGHDKDAAQAAIKSIKYDIEMNQLRDEYEKYIKEAPGAFTESVRNEIDHALDGEDIDDARIWIQTARTVIKFYRDYRDEIIDLTPKVQDPKVMQALAEALAKQELVVMSEAIGLAKREINFQSLVARARDILTDHRDLLAKLKPQVITWLEERSVPKDYSDEDVVKLKSAIDNAQWAMDEWQKRKDKYTDLWQYFINENVKSKEYKDLVMELRQAILDVDLAKADELIPKVEEQKAKHESDKAYREGVRAEWEKMMADVQRVKDALNKDTDLLLKAPTELIAAFVDFDINANGPRKIREGRKQYKEILDLAAKLGIEIVTGEVYTDNGVTFGPGMKVNKFADSSFTQKRKDKARWYKTKSACLHNYGPVADKYIKSASQEELDAQYNYTRGSGFMNRPLRGYNGGWYNFEGIGKVSLNNEKGTGADEIKAFTQFLDRCTYDFDVWVQRGIETDSGLKGFLGIDSLDEDKVNAMVGQTVCDMGFISCGSSKGTGFHGHILNIYCPKGTKLLYVENHSAFGGGNENETIIQRNTHFRITKVEKSGYRWYIDVEVVAQI